MTEEHGSKTERIAELKRKVAEAQELADACENKRPFEERISEFQSELSRLRNEGRETRKVRPPTESELALVTYHSRHASPLASVKAGRGEREALERANDWKGERKTSAEIVDEAIANLRRDLAVLSRGNGGEAVGTAERQRRESAETALREIQRIEDDQTIPDRRGKPVDSCTHTCLIECSKVAEDHFTRYAASDSEERGG
jgi:hypothetical protein